MAENPYQVPRSISTETPSRRRPTTCLTFGDWLAVPLASVAGGVVFELSFDYLEKVVNLGVDTLAVAALYGSALGGITALLVWLGLLLTRRGNQLPPIGMFLAACTGLIVAWGQWIAIRDYYTYFFGPFDFPLASAVYVAVNLTLMQAVLHLSTRLEK